MLDSTPEACEAPDDLRPVEDEPDDRPFDPWRAPKREAAKQLISDANDLVEALEIEGGHRKRKRRPRDQATFEAALSAILTDCIHHHLSHEPGGISITRSRDRLTRVNRYRPPFIGKTLPDLLDRLVDAELIDQEIAGNRPYVISHRQTIIRAGPLLREWIRERDIWLEDLSVNRKGHETIVLKRPKADHWDAGERIDYEDTDVTRSHREELAEINAFIEAADLDAAVIEGRLDTVDLENRYLCRHFTLGRFDRGGRLFGGFWQQMSKDERLETLLIDEEEVAELDYGQIALRIVYGLSGQQPTHADLYDIPSLEGHRDGIKKVMNSMLFMDRRPMRKPKGTASLLPKDKSIEEIVGAIEEEHPLIRDAFFRGIGHEVQFHESTILIEVLLSLKALGIVALPIHDAVLVPQSKAEDARRVMLEAFERLTGVTGAVERVG